MSTAYAHPDVLVDTAWVANDLGECSSRTWFVLTHLLGYPNVRNYDGSWTERGSMVRAPIEKE